MSREVLGESLSAVMDGEADELELRRVLGAAGEDPELRARWARYQLARSVMHQQAVRPGLDLAAAVSAAIAAEEVSVEAPLAIAPVRRGWSQIGRLAVAASVALAVLAGVRFYNAQNDAAVVAPQLAQEAPQAQPAAVQPALPVVTAPKGPAMLASYPESDDEEQTPPPAADDSQIIRELPRGTQVQPAAVPADGAGAR